MSFKKKILGYSVGPLGSVFFSLISLPLIAWSYSVSDVARFAIFQVVVVLYTLLFSFGLDQAYIREYYEANDKNKLLGQILKGVLIPSLFFIFIFSVFFRKQISFILYDFYSINLFLLTIFSAFFSLLIKILSSIQRVKEQALLFSLSQLMPKLFFLIFIGLFIHFSKVSFSNILWSQFLSITLVLLYFLIINRRDIVASFKCRLDSSLRKYYLFGFPLILTGAVIWGLKLADRFYLKIFSNLGELGIYSVAISISSGVVVFSGIFNTIWSPLVYKWVNSSHVKDPEIVLKVKSYSNKFSIIIFFIILILIPLSKLSVFVLPLKYSQIYLIIPLCALAPLFYTLSEITGIGINLMKKTNYTLWSCLVAIFFHIVISVALIPQYGAIGAAIAGATAFYMFLLVRSFFSKILWNKSVDGKVYVINFVTLVVAVAVGLQNVMF